MAVINIYSVLMEQSYWKDPEIFRPERHLSNDRKVIKSDHLLAFGSGKFL